MKEHCCARIVRLPGQIQAVGENTSLCMKVGDRVRVTKSVIVYNNPSHRNEPFDVKGLEGEVIGIRYRVAWQTRKRQPASASQV
jgi:hypothetical protein